MIFNWGKKTDLDKIEALIKDINRACQKQGFAPIETGFPVTSAQANALDSDLGLSLPKDYKDFLQKFGALAIGNNYFFGTWDSTMSDMSEASIRAITRLLRSIDLGGHLLPIFGSNYFSYICFDTKNHCLVLFNQESGTLTPYNHAKSFGAFLQLFLEAYLTKVS